MSYKKLNDRPTQKADKRTRGFAGPWTESMLKSQREGRVKSEEAAKRRRGQRLPPPSRQVLPTRVLLARARRAAYVKI